MNLRNTVRGIGIAAAISVSSLAMADDMGPQLKGDQIVKALVGVHLHGITPKGKLWGGVYKSDGTVTYDGGGTGTWRVDGDQFCDHASGDKEYCLTVYKLGDKKYQWMRSGGAKGSLVTVE